MTAREWLETDGLGGYAMGTADGVRTRRYHGLLVAATRPPGARMVLVADLEVFVDTARGRHALSSHRYRGGAVWPDGAGHIAAFAPSPWPRWEYALPDGLRIAAELWMAPGTPRVLLRWRRIAGDGAARLIVRPLLAGRDHHALHHENGGFRFDAEVVGDGASVTWRPYPGVPAITAIASGGYRHEPDWYRGFYYAEEAARGLEAEEDLATPGMFTFELDGDAVLAFEAGTGDDTGRASASRHDALRLFDRSAGAELDRRAAFPSAQHRAARAYLVARGDGRTIIAGYPWFTDWGRDTFIALRGLCLCTGALDEARAIVRTWIDGLSEGMLPNRFVESGGAPEYNTVDAALWFAIAADAVVATGACTDAEARAVTEAIAAIVAGYQAGTRHGIRVDDDGLVACGEPGAQVTWMDAKVGDWVVTPRSGKPVEVQALWASTLAIAVRRHPAHGDRYQAALARLRASFLARFWNPARGFLNDVVDCEHTAGIVDASLRPNQLFAVGGLPLSLLDPASSQARAVVDACERALWTPAGVRSLGPDEPGFQPRYGGDPVARDGAYHQGTVWPWLAGPFVEAWVRVRGNSDDARRTARARFLIPLKARLDDQGHLAELADAEPPHAPRGCPFQAWSLAELLRLELDVLR